MKIYIVYYPGFCSSLKSYGIIRILNSLFCSIINFKLLQYQLLHPTICKNFNKKTALKIRRLCIIYKQYYLNCGTRLVANSTILPIPSSGNLPSLKSASTWGNLFSISCRKCSSNSFTLLTGTSFINPLVPR